MTQVTAPKHYTDNVKLATTTAAIHVLVNYTLH